MNGNGKKLTVFYDGACPLCAREISFYQRRDGADAVQWMDASSAREDDVPAGLTKEQALARFHVQDSDGTLVSGGAAFSRLWFALPAFRPLGRLGQIPPVAWMLERAYDGFLKFRPALQAWVRARTDI